MGNSVHRASSSIDDLTSTQRRETTSGLSVKRWNTSIVGRRDGEATLASINETLAVLAENISDISNIMAVDTVGRGTAERRGLGAAAAWWRQSEVYWLELSIERHTHERVRCDIGALERLTRC